MRSLLFVLINLFTPIVFGQFNSDNIYVGTPFTDLRDTIQTVVSWALPAKAAESIKGWEVKYDTIPHTALVRSHNIEALTDRRLTTTLRDLTPCTQYMIIVENSALGLRAEANISVADFPSHGYRYG